MITLRGKTFFTGYRWFSAEGWYPEVDTMSWASKTVSVELVGLEATAILATKDGGRRATRKGTGASRRTTGNGQQRKVT